MANRRKRAKGIVLYCRASQIYWCMGLAIFFAAITLVACAGFCVSRGRMLGMLAPFLAGGVGTAVSLAGCAYFGIKRPRLILDEDFLLMHYGRGDVAGQIPYRNIASVELVVRADEDDHKWSYLEITFVNRKDPDTWWPEHFGKGFHIDLRDEYDKPLSWILGRIRTRVDGERQERRDRMERQ